MPRSDHPRIPGVSSIAFTQHRGDDPVSSALGRDSSLRRWQQEPRQLGIVIAGVIGRFGIHMHDVDAAGHQPIASRDFRSTEECPCRSLSP